MSTATANPGGDDELRMRSQKSPLASQRAKENNTPTEENKTGRMSSYFTLGYKEAYNQWCQDPTAEEAEHKVLSYIPFLKSPSIAAKKGSGTPSISSSHEGPTVKTTSTNDPYGARKWETNQVHLSGKNRALNEFSVERLDEQTDENMVMLHGYGAGLGFFYKNFEGLSRVPGWKVYALDLLGMGRSSRPPFKIRSKDRQMGITEAEKWFIDALEEWRIKRNIDRFTLLGHSLGGYMAVAYALKYPGHLKKLVLASPVGIPEDPYAVNAALPEPSESTMINEFTQDQDDTVKSGPNSSLPNGGDNNNFMNARSKREQAAKNDDNKAPVNPRKPLPKWLTYLWDANISPFSLVRWSGPLGPRFVSGWTSRRFSHLDPNEAQALHTYAYTLFKQRGSGEYALAYILAPGAFARSPLIRRIAGVGRQYLQPDGTTSSTVADAARKRENGYPIVLMYGENDWMDIAGGFDAEQRINDERAKIAQTASAEEKDAENGSAKVMVIKKAGHHVYLDGWEEFNDVMRKEMKDVSEHSKKK